MRRFYTSESAIVISILFLLVLVAVLPACRPEREPLDRNRAPDTYLTIAPPETTEAEYRVHVYWSGEDRDGIVTRYMWYRSDTLRTLRPDLEPEMELLDWNPEARASDYVRGHFTYATDTLFVFTGYDRNTGALLNRQAFHIVAIDDVGRMDPTPARIQFNAKIDCIPTTDFWTSENGVDWKKYSTSQLDTISMFKDICVKFSAQTCNNYITGYRWIYQQTTYPPDANGDGIPEWYVPEVTPVESVTVCIENNMDNYLPSGDFYFMVIARDEAGGLSRSDIISGEGVARVVINYDPDTRILHGDNFFTQQSGDTAIRTINFSDDKVDTLPYNSRLRMHYIGWDDSRDILQYTDPPLPISFQFMFGRWGYAPDGNVSSYNTPWYPTDKAEDTNCYADEDSVTMRIGTYKYFFVVRSFDEQYRADGTPDTVGFYGNYSPTIEDVEIGIDMVPATPSVEYLPISGDTLYVNISTPFAFQNDTCNAYSRVFNAETQNFTYLFKFFIKASGHDDRRDPPGSGITSWMFTIGTEEDYYYRFEGEWVATHPRDEMLQECVFRLVVPADPAYQYPWPDSMFVSQQPGWMGNQSLRIMGKDIKATDTFNEGMRATKPVFDPGDPCVMTSLGQWVTVRRYPSNYARLDIMDKQFYIKLIYVHVGF